jgi:hypothetical protein
VDTLILKPGHFTFRYPSLSQVSTLLALGSLPKATAGAVSFIGTQPKVGRSARAGPHLLWGGFCQGGAPRVLSIFSSFSFFVRPGQPFLRPDPHSEWPARAGAVKAGPAHWAATDRLGLDGFEHDGILVVVGMTTSEGSSHAVDEHSRPHPSIRWAEDPDHDAVMRIGSESSEAADPFWGTAFEAMVRTGTPPPRTVIGDPSRACRQGPKPSGVL